MRSNGPFVTSHKDFGHQGIGVKAPAGSTVWRGQSSRPPPRATASIPASEGFAATRAANLPGHAQMAATSPAELARLLTGVRTALGYSEIELAMRLATTPRVVFALENGWLEALPAWPETRRIVDGWVAAAGLDPRPALEALARAMQPAGGATAHPSPALAAAGRGPMQRLPEPLRQQTSAAPAAAADMSHEGLQEGGTVDVVAPRPRFNARLPQPKLPASRLVRLGMLGIVAAGLWVTTTQTAVVAAAVATLPAPAERAVRSISDFLAVRFAPLREGHRWIDVDDPRSRRGDKLRIGRRSD